MQTSSSSPSSGIGFVGLLALLFIALKLTGHIDWSWWWVLAPIWLAAIPVVFFGGWFLFIAWANRWRD